MEEITDKSSKQSFPQLFLA